MPEIVFADLGAANASLLFRARRGKGRSLRFPILRKPLSLVALRATIKMIRTFQHKGLKAFFETGSLAGIQASHAPRLGAMLRRLNESASAQGMNLPGWRLHPLKGRELEGHFSVRVSGNWRMTFKFEGTDAVLVDYRDYH